jgi:RNA polymerase sporulation-specific sigma factor
MTSKEESKFWKDNEPIMYLAIEGLFAPGYTKDDLLNEARLGLWLAKNRWDSSKGAGWFSFSYTLARRKVMDLVTLANRKKHTPLHSYSDLELSGCFNIPESFEINEAKTVVTHLMSQIELTDLERDVMDCYFKDMGYTETAKKLGINYKKVDNAIQRVRKKLREFINSDTRDFSFLP